MLERDEIMEVVYRLQQRLAITNVESQAILFLAGLLILGLVLQEIRHSTQASDLSVIYAREDSLFEVQSRRMRGLSHSSTDTTDTSRVSAPERPGNRTSVRMNINTATPSQLRHLPGIGPVLAKRIVAFREQYGRFQSETEIQEVSGIGPKTYAQLKPLIFVSSDHPPTSADSISP